MSPLFSALPTEPVAALRAGGPDANGRPAEHHLSDGGGNPCRHCLTDIAEGRPMLVLAWRPFPALQPYAETGPIFLCGEPCDRHPDSAEMPTVFRRRAHLMMRGYGTDDRIVYGTGKRAATDALEAACTELFADPRVAYIHLRSALDTCYQARVDRGG